MTGTGIDTRQFMGKTRREGNTGRAADESGNKNTVAKRAWPRCSLFLSCNFTAAASGRRLRVIPGSNRRPGKSGGVFAISGTHASLKAGPPFSLPKHKQILMRDQQEVILHTVGLPIAGRLTVVLLFDYKLFQLEARVLEDSHHLE